MENKVLWWLGVLLGPVALIGITTGFFIWMVGVTEPMPHAAQLTARATLIIAWWLGGMFVLALGGRVMRQWRRKIDRAQVREQSGD